MLCAKIAGAKLPFVWIEAPSLPSTDTAPPSPLLDFTPIPVPSLVAQNGGQIASDAATPTYALGQNAICAVTGSGDEGVGLQFDGDDAAIAARAAGTASARGKVELPPDHQAAAAADRLCQDRVRVRALCRDGAAA